jgi:hypothetical protein
MRFRANIKDVNALLRKFLLHPLLRVTALVRRCCSCFVRACCLLSAAATASSPATDSRLQCARALLLLLLLLLLHAGLRASLWLESVRVGG